MSDVNLLLNILYTFCLDLTFYRISLQYYIIMMYMCILHNLLLHNYTI